MQLVVPTPSQQLDLCPERVCSPEEAILVCTDSVGAHPRVGGALIQFQDTGMHRARHVQWRGTVEIQLRTSEDICEEGVRVEQTCRLLVSRNPAQLFSVCIYQYEHHAASAQEPAA